LLNSKTKIMSRPETREKLMKVVFLLAALSSILALFLIMYFIFSAGIPFIKEYGLKEFLFGQVWSPINSPQKYGIWPMIVGSVILTVGAALVGTPIGILSAVYLSYYAKGKLKYFFQSAVSLMASVPSIIYGFFALQLMVPISRALFGGTGMNIITASVLLGIMILPTIISISESSLNAVPNRYYQGSVALGATKEISIFRTMIPAAKSGILSSVILGIGRAIGETMAVYMIAGNQPRLPKALTDGVRTLTTNIVLEMAYAGVEHRQALIATAMVLFIFILVINFLFFLMKRRDRHE